MCFRVKGAIERVRVEGAFGDLGGFRMSSHSWMIHEKSNVH